MWGTGSFKGQEAAEGMNTEFKANTWIMENSLLASFKIPDTARLQVQLS